MKTLSNGILLALVTVAAMANTGSQAQTTASSVSPAWQWRFDTAANPASPEVAAGSAVASQAVITKGQFASGWMNQAAGLDGATGIWDLGRSGSITLTLPAGSLPAGLAKVTVRQWNDGAFFRKTAAVTLAGSSGVAGPVTAVTAATALGGWVDQLTQVQVPADSAAAQTIVIAGAYDGAVIDSVTVQAVATQAAVVLSIQPVPGSDGLVEISWPASSPGTLETSSDAADAQGWSGVAATSQVVGDRNVVTVKAAATMQFFRLKQ